MTNKTSRHHKGGDACLHAFAFAALSLSFGLLAGSTQMLQAAPAAKKPAAKQAAAKPAAPAAAAASGPVSSSLTAAYKEYAEQIKKKIGDNWWNYPNGKHHVVLTVTINPDGSAGDMQLSSTPHSGEAEQAAADAFNKTQPLPSLPSGSPPCKLQATFDSTADQYTSKTNFNLKMEPFPQKATQAQAPVEAPATETPPAESK